MLHPDANRLFALDAALRAEADQVLAESGIGPILQEGGYQPVGSYLMRTMVWRDLDFERYQEPDWPRHWEIGTRLAGTGWCVRLQCIDVYREAWQDFGLYWGLRVADPARVDRAEPGNPTVWNLDLWTGRRSEFEPSLARRRTWDSLLTDELRSHLLAIKEVVHTQPEYRKSLLSVHIYQAVLERGIRGIDDFRRWWQSTHGDMKD
jgi:hypothetical protein